MKDINFEDVKANIENFLSNNLSVNDMVMESWYERENKELQKLAIKYNVALNIVCGIVALTSPNMSWSLNVICAESILNGSGKMPGYTININKAKSLLKYYRDNGNIDDNKIIENFGFGPKTGPFYENLLHPTTSQLFTLDIWMLRIALNDSTLHIKHGVTKKQCDTIRQIYFDVYKKMGFKDYGIMPHQMQSALWTKVRD